MKVKINLSLDQLKRDLEKTAVRAIDKALKKEFAELQRQNAASWAICVAAYHASDPWGPPK